MSSTNKNKFEVFPVENDEEFAKYLAECLTYPNVKVEEKIENRFHFKYFLNYLWKDADGLKAQTILLEKDYTSASYLGDYINYYAHCYRPYLKKCRRVHFFREKFDDNTFVRMLTDSKCEYDKNWKSYLGYIVVKPLPKGVIGATLIKPYDKKDKRFYTAKRDYSVNLFGKTLNIESLPYQEQDGIVGSCASSALWFAFQKTRELFHTSVPNPSDITISAGYDSFHTGKSFPSNGLEISQICMAVHAIGLISELRVSSEYISDNKWLKSFVYAYSRMGIPILMGMDIEKRGEHLITINGYRFSHTKKKTKRISKIDLELQSNEIIKFYAHDDQTGPFSRVEFVSKGYQFNTSWWDNINSEIGLGANAICIIVPLVNTIKVTFENILEEATILDFVFDMHIELKFTWDIYLIESNKYKEEIRSELIKNDKQYNSCAAEILFESLPKYVWVAKAYIRNGDKDYLIFDLLYDAIDVNYKKTPFFTNIYNSSFKETLDRLSIRDEFSIFKKTITSEDKRADLYTILTEEQTVLNSIESVQEELQKNSLPTNTTAIIAEINKDGVSKAKVEEAIVEEISKIKNKLTDFNKDIDERI
ncbi:MAG: hypothetical protein EHM93_00420 [Bacteroidales bacterium]|nr:MAG: hypothetical protein EHM93_00420 [Bacteroidales bacterium]